MQLHAEPSTKTRCAVLVARRVARPKGRRQPALFSDDTTGLKGVANERGRSVTLLVTLALVALTSQSSANDESAQFFESQVRPLLIQNCQSCHGEKKQEAGLRLDSRDALLTGGDTGPSIVPGKPDESLLIQAVRHDGEIKMPPKKKLAESQIAALTRWVETGATWPVAPPTFSRSSKQMSMTELPDIESLIGVVAVTPPPNRCVTVHSFCR